MQSTPSEQPSESSDNESEESWRPSDESSSDESSSGESDGGEELVEQPVNASREWCVAHWTQPAFEHTPKKGAVEKIPDRFLKEGHIMVTETGNILELAAGNVTTTGPGTVKGNSEHELPGLCSNAIVDFQGAACNLL